MHRFERERLQNKHVQSPLQDLPWPIRHRSPLFLYSYWHPSGAYACPTGCQEETLRYGCNSQAGIPAPVSVKPPELTQFLEEVGVYQVLQESWSPSSRKSSTDEPAPDAQFWEGSQ